MTNQAKPRIVIYVEGGVVQCVLSDTAGVEAMIVDYDNEKAGDDPACRSFEPVNVHPEYIDNTIRGIEELDITDDKKITSKFLEICNKIDELEQIAHQAKEDLRQAYLLHDELTLKVNSKAV